MAISLLNQVMAGNGSPVAEHPKRRGLPSTTDTSEVFRANILGCTNERKREKEREKERVREQYTMWLVGYGKP